MKILYAIQSLAHKRVLEPFEEQSGVEQIILAPDPKITSNIVPEDYRDFGIKNIKHYNNINNVGQVIKKINPDIVAQTFTRDIKHSSKKVYISHGMIGNHVVPMIKKGAGKKWAGFDLYCGATEWFKDWINHATGKEERVILNAMPQFDLLTNDYVNRYKNKIIAHTQNKKPNKTILLCGFCCKDRPDFAKHNEDYFASVIELEKIARKHNFLILVKPRQSFSETLAFLNKNKWGQKYTKDYKNIQNSKYLHFINTTSHIYRYYFVDAVVCNGCSTAEIETCILNKPLIMVRTKTKTNNYDPFDTVRSGAAILVNNASKLESVVLSALSNNGHIDKQNALLNTMNIMADGNAHKRVLEAMLKL